MPEEKEVSLIDIIKDLKARVEKLEEENLELRRATHRGFTTSNYDDIYREVMKRTARDLTVKRERLG